MRTAQSGRGWQTGMLVAGASLGLLQAAPQESVTFAKDVAPILYERCVGCHRAGEIGPMPLVTYKDVRPWAAAIREAVASRTMPPWYADSRYGHFANDPRLSDAQIAAITAWAKSGAKEGDPKDLPPLPKFSNEWTFGKPDAVVDIGQDYPVKQSNVKDEYTYFTVPSGFTEDRWVKAVELRPGNRRVVHHSHVWVEIPPDPAKAGEKAAAKPTQSYMYKVDGLSRIKPDAPVVDNGCQAEDGGNLPGRKVNDGSGPLGSYLPGKEADVYPPGTAKLIPKGALLKFQVHYNNATGQPQTDRSQVGFVFADRPPEQPLKRVDSSAYLFLIPPGAPNHEVSNCTTFQKDVLLLSYVAHMHYRGKDMKLEIERPGGQRETLVSVPHYSFAWQQIYRVREPVFVPKGSKLIVTAHFDNSANNRWNPDPAQVVRWGEPSEAEMMDGWVEYIDAPAKEKLPLSAANPR